MFYRPLGVEMLQLHLQLLQYAIVQERPQVGIAHKLPKLHQIDLQRHGAPLRKRRIVLIHKIADIAEYEGAAKRRGMLQRDRNNAHTTAFNLPQDRNERIHVEDILQDLSKGLQYDRERGESGGSLQ